MQTTALVIFTITYVLIAAQKIPRLRLDRPAASLLGAAAMLVAGVLTLDEAYAAISFDTITLLLGMMIIIAYLQEAAFFRWIGYEVIRRAGTPQRLLAMIILVAGGLSALFVNDTICLMLTPLVAHMCNDAEVDPVPYLIALATASNIGSAATLTGNPQNMLIGTYSGIGYGEFLAVMAPVSALALAADYAVIRWFFRARMPKWRAMPEGHGPHVDRRVVAIGMFVMTGVLVSFFVTGALPLTAIAGAAVMVALVNRPSLAAFKFVDWSLLLFFAALFVLIGGLTQTGLTEQVFDSLTPHMGGTPGAQLWRLGAASLVFSNIVSNVPFVMLVRDWIPTMPNAHALWLMLAMSSTFAGNFTIIGSVANLIVMERSRDVVHIGFLEFFRVGAVVTIVSMLIGVVVLLLVV